MSLSSPQQDWQALLLSLKLASLSTVLLLLLSLPLARWLASRPRGARFFATLFALPLVLPPTVLGFYLLLAFSRIEFHGQSLAFSFSGLLLGSLLYSLPFVLQPLEAAFVALPANLRDLGRTLRLSPLRYFFVVELPLIRGSILSAAILGFTHTLGEFGVVLMLGANIPGETRVLSIAIYDLVETLQYEQAHLYAGGLLLFSFISLYIVQSLRSDL